MIVVGYQSQGRTEAYFLSEFDDDLYLRRISDEKVRELETRIVQMEEVGFHGSRISSTAACLLHERVVTARCVKT